MSIFEARFSRKVPDQTAWETPDAEGPAVWIVPAILCGLFVLFVVVAGFQREIMGYGTETDYIGSMVPEARNLLAGVPLTGEFHPPGFTVVLAGAYKITGDWFTAGKLISGVSGLVALLLAARLFTLLAGPWAGAGAVVGMVSSATFLGYSIEASSDIYFLALFLLTSLVVCQAAVQRSAGLWVLAGLLVGTCVLTRTNGITQLLLLAIPLFQSAGFRYRAGAIGAAIVGLALVIGAAMLFASVTGSNIMPKGTYDNIALTYFTEERISWEGILEVQSRFNSLTEVLLHDPATMARRYVSDLYRTVVFDVPSLSGPFLALLFLPGLILAAGARGRTLFLLLLAATVAQILLVNLKAYLPRYYLFVTPWIGAGGLVLLRHLMAAPWPELNRRIAVGVVWVMLGMGVLLSFGSTAAGIGNGNRELVEAMPELQRNVTAGDAIISRKPHTAFYTDSIWIWLPEVEAVGDLRSVAEAAKAEGIETVFLFFGRMEGLFRPELAAKLETLPDWLTPVARGSGADPWVLYRFDL